jgi:hypothetical protein
MVTYLLPLLLCAVGADPVAKELDLKNLKVGQEGALGRWDVSDVVTFLVYRFRVEVVLAEDEMVVFRSSDPEVKFVIKGKVTGTMKKDRRFSDSAIKPGLWRVAATREYEGQMLPVIWFIRELRPEEKPRPKK